MKHFILSCLTFFLSCMAFLHGETPAPTIPPITPAQKTSFYSQLQREIDVQKKRAGDLQDLMGDTSRVVTTATQRQFEQSVAVLNVKETLYQNFYETPSINYPVIRQMLLNVFRKSVISEADLAELQATVKQEKAKYAVQAQAAPAVTQPTATPSK